MSVLIQTKCGVSCGFSKISVFCFDCPALLCKTCNIDLHKKIKHNVMPFKNNNISWENKNFITGLFKDKSLGNRVFEEVTRKIEEPRKFKPELETPTKRVTVDGWLCQSCTFENPKEKIKCEMCLMFRTIEDFSGEYNSKVEKYMVKINPLFCKLDDIDDASFENIVFVFINNADTSADFIRWFKDKYLNGKSVTIISHVIEEAGHNITLKELEDRYREYVTRKNRELLKTLPESIKVVGQKNKLLEIEDFNKAIALPNEMTNSTEVTVDELWAVITTANQYTEGEIRMIMIELNLPSIDNVKFLRLFVNNPKLGPYLKSSCPHGTVKIDHVRQACLEQILIDDVINFLKKECCLCCDDFPMPGMQPLLICSHEFCKNCFKQWLCENVRERYPCKWGCPGCEEESYLMVDKSLHYFNLKEFIVENHCGDDILKIFDEKLLNERLMGSPNFHWCANDKCVNGFEAEGQNKKIQCPSCHMHMCVDCNREWKEQHENVTCEEYELWILKNDPNLAKVLNDIGIECPKCGMRYALAPGGCLHFECKKCAWVFCGGCYMEFTNKCTTPGCTLGTAFHGHHPRNCLYYMRDYSPVELENMLKNADYPKLKDKPEKKCPFIIAEEKSLANKPCGDDVIGTTGLCERHYKEYLVQFINRLKIDPASVANSNTLNIMLFQGLKKKLDKLKGENEDAFVVRLRNEVVKSCKLYVPKGLEAAGAHA